MAEIALPSPDSDASPHRPVLYHEIIHALQPRSGGRYVDGTLGAGGHAWGILNASGPDGLLLGLDVDPQALTLAHARLAPFGERAVIRGGSYVHMAEVLAELRWPPLQGILLDLGLSSMQLDTAERGFSFQSDAPLDMRFDPATRRSAADLVNGLEEAELARILSEYGEEPQARKIARRIVEARPLQTTQQLAQVVLRAVSAQRKGARRGERHDAHHRHPATQVFQALRIAVNGELEAVEAVLPLALAALAPGGRLAVIAFHSLEDRLVKQFMRRESSDCICPPRLPMCVCGHTAMINEVTRKPIVASEAEASANPRARSARLRVAEKL